MIQEGAPLNPYRQLWCPRSPHEQPRALTPDAVVLGSTVIFSEETQMQTRGMGMVVEVFTDGFVRVRHWDLRSGEEQNVRLQSSQCQVVEVPDIVETTLKSAAAIARAHQREIKVRKGGQDRTGGRH